MDGRAEDLTSQLERERPEYLEQVQNSPVTTSKTDAMTAVTALGDVLTTRENRRFVQSPRQYTGSIDDVEVVVHMGCHSVKTPVVIDATLDVVEGLGYTAVGLGGYNNCCGIADLKRGDIETAEQVDSNRFENLAAFKPQYAIAECTSCHAITNTLSLGYREPEFAFPSLIDFLHDHRAQLGEAAPVDDEVTVAFHDHFDGRDWMPTGQADTAREVVRALPGVQVVELAHSKEDRLPCMHTGDPTEYPYEDLNDQILTEATECNADYTLTFWHACQRSLLYYDHLHPVTVRNFSTFIANRLGYTYDDPLRRYIQAGARGDLEWIMDDARDTFTANGMTEDEARAVITHQFGSVPS